MTGYLSLWPPRAVEARATTIGSTLELEAIVRAVAERYGLTVEDLKSPRRERWCSWPRQEAMMAAHDTGRFSTPRIGRWLGGRDHTTVLYGIAECLQRQAARVETPRRPENAKPSPPPRARPSAPYTPPVRRLTPGRPRRMSPSQRHLAALYAALAQEQRP